MFKKMTKRDVIESITPYDFYFIKEQELNELKNKQVVHDNCLTVDEKKEETSLNTPAESEEKKDDGDDIEINILKAEILKQIIKLSI